MGGADAFYDMPDCLVPRVRNRGRLQPSALRDRAPQSYHSAPRRTVARPMPIDAARNGRITRGWTAYLGFTLELCDAFEVRRRP